MSTEEFPKFILDAPKENERKKQIALLNNHLSTRSYVEG